MRATGLMHSHLRHDVHGGPVARRGRPTLDTVQQQADLTLVCNFIFIFHKVCIHDEDRYV
jgi:hypothetical protein